MGSYIEIYDFEGIKFYLPRNLDLSQLGGSRKRPAKKAETESMEETDLFSGGKDEK